MMYFSLQQQLMNQTVWNECCSSVQWALCVTVVCLFSTACGSRHWLQRLLQGNLLTSSSFNVPSSSTLAPLTWFHTSSHTLLHGRRFKPRGESSCDLAHLEDMFESQTQMKLPRMDNKGLVHPLFHWTALSAFHKLPFTSWTGLIAWTRIFHMHQLMMYEGNSSNLHRVLSWRCTATLSRMI